MASILPLPFFFSFFFFCLKAEGFFSFFHFLGAKVILHTSLMGAVYLFY